MSEKNHTHRFCLGRYSHRRLAMSDPCDTFEREYLKQLARGAFRAFDPEHNYESSHAAKTIFMKRHVENLQRLLAVCKKDTSADRK